jgi:hypothetical protein
MTQTWRLAIRRRQHTEGENMFHTIRMPVLSTCFLYALAAFASSSFAADDRQLVLKAADGKDSCLSTTAPLGASSVEAGLCVARANFAHDVYTLKIDGQTVVRGIDDDTTAGISSDYKNQKLQLRCAAQNAVAKDTPEATLLEVQKLMPNSSVDETRHIAALLVPGGAGMEIGRLCTASSEGRAFLTVQVLFP